MSRTRDRWIVALEDARASANECEDALRLREAGAERGDDKAWSKRTLEARRIVSGLKAKLRALEEMIARDRTMPTTTTSEVERREDALRELRTRAEDAARLVAKGNKKTQQTKNSDSGSTRHDLASSSTYDEEHAVRSPEEVLLLQREMLDEQDDALDDLSTAAERAKDISRAVNDELDLHAKLLDGLEDEVEDTRGRLHLVSRAVKRTMQRGSNCRQYSIVLLVLIVCVLMLCLIIKLQGP
jgi:chromosome segregation ATPase